MSARDRDYARGATADSGLDADLHHVAVVLCRAALGVAVALDLFTPLFASQRVALLVCTLAGVSSVRAVRSISWWRMSRVVYLLFFDANLALLAGMVALSGGWTSPFRVFIPLVVAFSALCAEWRRAIPVAVAGGLASASTALYTHGGSPIPVALAGVGAYMALVYAIGVVMQRARGATAHVAAREQIERRARGLVTLQRVSAIVGGHLSTDDALAAIVEELDRAFGHQLVSIYVRDGDNLVLQAQAGYTEPYATIPLGIGICGRVGASGETAFVPDVRLDPTYRPAVEGVVSELCVPLRDAGDVAGILNVESVATLTELDRELLELFAAQVSVVLRNARQTEVLREQADCDPLTGLLNHRALMEGLDRALATAGTPCAVLLLDVDDFKFFNDSYGHLAGDAILRRVAHVLRENCRDGDLAGRYGGDEFVAVLRGASRAAADVVAARVARAVGEDGPTASDRSVGPLAVSVGVAVAPADGSTRRELLAGADAAMYAIKRNRRLLV